MNMLTRLFLSLFIIALTPLSAFAQEAGTIRPSLQQPDRSYHANPYYDHAVRQAMMHMADDFSFFRLRNLYSNTRQYDPLGEDTINRMQELAFIVQSNKSQEERAEAIEEYRILVMQHMGNIRVVAQALSFARLDRIFGNRTFFAWLRRGLVGSIMASGDGKSIDTAYYIITLSEETILIGQLDMNIKSTTESSQGNASYNMHEVEDIHTGQRSTLFVNTTHPMAFMRTKQAQQNAGDIGILRQ